MELVNQTPVPAELFVTTNDLEPNEPRIGMLVAKATFLIDEGGNTTLDTQDPVPLLIEDEQTELGILPSDQAFRRDPKFEVAVLGAAYSQTGRPVESMQVALSVGAARQVMQVTGDRAWIPGDRRRTTRPVPFTRMPLTYAQAYGGSATLQLDADTEIDVDDPMNRHGRGFDAEQWIQLYKSAFNPPPGFPRLEYVRKLPNLEHPQHRVQRWADAPDPYCWAPIPIDIGFAQVQQFRMLQAMHAAGVTDMTPMVRKMETLASEIFHRAHPDWIIDLPPAGSRVNIEGMSARPMSFPLPPLRVVADYVVGERQGERELVPQLLMLLPEERRLYIVYRVPFTVETAPDMERSFRLRTEQGWFRHPPPSRS